MALPSSLVRALTLAGVVGLVEACGGGGQVATRHSPHGPTSSRSVGARSARPSQSSPPSNPASAGPPTTTPAGSALGRPAGASASTATASSPASSGPPTPSGPAPAAGNYKYESTDPQGQVTQLNVDVKTNSASGSVTGQTSTISSPQGSEANTYAWNPARGVTVSSTSLSGGSASVDCDWTPDIGQYVFPIHSGASWSSLSRCATTVAGAPTTATFDDKATVGGYQQVQVAGRTLDTWVIHRTAVLRAKSATFDLTITTVSTEYLDPADGLTPKELTDTTTAGSYAGRSFSQEARATIEAESLTPTG